MKKLLFYALIILSLAGCNHANRFDSTMNKADSIMEANQENAKTSLTILKDLKPRLSEMSKAQRMRFYLLYSKAMNKECDEFTSDSIMKAVVKYYNFHGSDYEKMTAHYLLGCVYRDMGDAPSALKCLGKAIDYAENDKQSYLLLAHIHAQMADMYGTQALVRQELSEHDLSAQYALMAGDTIDAITSYNLKASAYALINKMDSSIIINDSAINMFIKLNKLKYAAQISGQSVEFNVEKGNYKKAKQRMDFHEKSSGFFDGGEIEKGREVYYYFKGLYYIGVNNKDSADYYFRKCLRFKKDPNMAVAGYHGLSLLYQKIGKADSTAKYAMLAYNANDSSYQAEAAEALLRQQAQYNYSKHQETALASAEQAASLQRWLFGAFVTLVILVCSTLLIYVRKKRMVQKKMTMMQERYETEKTLLQREMEEMNALLEERQSLLESKDDLLERKKKELNFEIEKREVSIAELQERVAGFERDMNVRDIAVLEDEIQNAPLKDDFSYFLINVSEHPSTKKWEELSKFAKSKLPKLYVMLRKNKVTEREFRICILTRLMFKPGDIAVIVGCRFPEVSLTRSRLLKKIYGIDGKSSDFDKRIMLMF